MQKWSLSLARKLHQEINDCCIRYGHCNVMLTGGQSARTLYKHLGKFLTASSAVKDIRLYFGDERCVDPDHKESNFRAAREALFRSSTVPPTITINRIHGEAKCADAEASRYERGLPERIDLLLLSVGEDGHIASLFPKSSALFEKEKRIVAVVNPRLAHNRISITPRVIAEAQRVFVMATTPLKKAIYADIQLGHTTVWNTPAVLAKNGIWIFGDD